MSKNTIALWRSVMDFDKVVDSVDDVYLLASVICAKYRSDSDNRRGRAVLRCADRCRLITALNRLAELAAKELPNKIVRSLWTPINRIFLKSYLITQESASQTERKTIQYLTVEASGIVRLFGYTCDTAKSRYLGRSIRCVRIGTKDVKKIFADAIAQTKGNFDTADADGFAWRISFDDARGDLIRTSSGTGRRFVGADGENAFCDRLRQVLKMPELLLFDGKARTETMRKIRIDYSSDSAITPASIAAASSDVAECVRESLILDASKGMWEYFRESGGQENFCLRFRNDRVVSDLVEEFDLYELRAIAEKKSDRDDYFPKTGKYSIAITYDDERCDSFCGRYASNELPSEWGDWMSSVMNMTYVNGWGVISNPNCYRQSVRRAGEYIFASVRFNAGGRSYYYLTDDSTISVGDTVYVCVGDASCVTEAEVVDISYFTQEESPFPFDRLKWIVGKEED